MNQLESAVESFRRAIKLDGRDYMPQLNLGIALNRQNKFQEAAKALEKLHQEQPEIVAVNPHLIEALIGCHQWVEAEKVIKQSLTQKEVDKIDLQMKLGAVLLRQSKADEAILVLTEVVAAEPDNALAQLNLGASLLQSGNLDKSEAALRRAYQIEGANLPGAQLLLGQLYFQKKDYAQAITAFETYLRELPDAPNAAQIMDAIRKLREAIGTK